MLFKEIIAVHSENSTAPVYTLCGQNAELLNVRSRGTYSYHCVLNDSNSTVPQEVKKFAAFMEPEYSLLLTEVCHLALSLASGIQPTPLHHSSPRSIFYLLLGLSSLLMPSD
jgi:hypothetical protein